MDSEAIRGRFGAIALFSGFGDDQLKLLDFVSETRRLAAGTALYEAGMEADGAYVLVSGMLEGVDETGTRYDIAPPALVGEIGLMLSRPRATSVFARTGAEVIFVPREPFLKILKGDPALAAEVAEILRAELASYLESVTRLGPRFSG